MPNPSAEESFVSVMKGVFHRIAVFEKNNRRKIISGVVLLSLSILVFSFFRWYLTQEITLLTGPSGGRGARFGEIVEEQFNPSNSTSKLFHFGVTVKAKETEGYEDNRKKIQKMKKNVIGFTHDGFGEAEKLRVLLPLDRVYLHIFISRNGLERFCNSCQAETPKTGHASIPNTPDEISPAQRFYGELAKYVGWKKEEPKLDFREIVFSMLQPRNYKPRFCLGPKESGTRRISKILLESIGLGDGLYSEVSNSSWSELPQMLSSGQVDVAFLLAPMDSSIVEQIKETERAALVSISDAVGKAIQNKHPQILSVEKEVPASIRQQFGFPTETKVQTDHFCKHWEVRCRLLSTKRLLVCPSSMSDRMAFSLAKSLRKILDDAVPSLRWEFSQNPEAATEDTYKISYRYHPGADMLRNNEEPSSLAGVMGFIWPIIAPFGIALFGFGLSRLDKVINQPASPGDRNGGADTDPTGDEPHGPESPEAEQEVQEDDIEEQEPITYELLTEKVNKLEESIDYMPMHASKRKLKSVEKECLDLAREIRSVSEDQISLKQERVLLRGVNYCLMKLRVDHYSNEAVREPAR